MSIVTDGHWPDETDALLRALPEWFGIEESVRAYVNAARTLPTVAALVDDRIVGVCLVRRHTPVAAEIELLAVRRDLHRAGIGRRLVERAVADLTASGVRLLQVKTRGPSGESEEYAADARVLRGDRLPVPRGAHGYLGARQPVLDHGETAALTRAVALPRRIWSFAIRLGVRALAGRVRRRVRGGTQPR